MINISNELHLSESGNMSDTTFQLQKPSIKYIYLESEWRTRIIPRESRISCIQ